MRTLLLLLSMLWLIPFNITLLNFEGHLAVVLYYSRVLLTFAIGKEGYWPLLESLMERFMYGFVEFILIATADCLFIYWLDTWAGYILHIAIFIAYTWA